jgi:hypothetical protein
VSTGTLQILSAPPLLFSTIDAMLSLSYFKIVQRSVVVEIK